MLRILRQTVVRVDHAVGNAMVERSGGEKVSSLDPRGQAVPYHAAITNLATIRGRYAPVWAMAGTGTPANLINTRDPCRLKETNGLTIQLANASSEHMIRGRNSPQADRPTYLLSHSIKSQDYEQLEVVECSSTHSSMLCTYHEYSGSG